MKIVVLRDPDRLDACYAEVASLFSVCYQKPLERSVWKQFYLRPPYRVSVGVCAYAGGKLTGFTGLVAQHLTGPRKQRFDYLLPITLMLHPSARCMGNFMRLIDGITRVAREEGVDAILGFPNDNSYRLLTRWCNWKILNETAFYQISADTSADLRKPLHPVSSFETFSTEEHWCVPYGDLSYLKWRSARHRYKLVSVGDEIRVVYKKLEPRTLDLLDAAKLALQGDGRAALQSLARSENCSRILLSGYHAGQLGLKHEDMETAGSYKFRMCALPFVETLPDIHLSLLMSDVY